MVRFKKIFTLLLLISISFLPLNSYIANDGEYEEYSDEERASIIES